MNLPTQSLDLIVVGGGLSGLLAAWLRLAKHPTERVLVLESAPQLAGDHTWSFNLSDIPSPLLLQLEPMIVHQWPAYTVRFPAYSRILQAPYATSNSNSLREAIAPLIANGQLLVRTQAAVNRAEPSVVHLANGDSVSSRAVLDARGGLPHDSMQLGYQKFAGLTVRTEQAHGLQVPCLMDATVAQVDGYRFLYCLPFSETEMLIEDTYYADSPHLNADLNEQRITQYAQQQGWKIAQVLRHEQGVLPIALSDDADAALAAEAGCAPKIGLAGGLFHATTGYSLPDAARVASAIAQIPELNADSLRDTVHTYRRHHAQRHGFFRLLNRMLFGAAQPDQRYRLLQRFYRMNEGLIQRFFAGSLRPLDKARILCGRPPVPLLPALSVVSEQNFRRQARAAT